MSWLWLLRCLYSRPKVRRKNKMKTNKAYFLIGLIIASALFFEVAAHADEYDLTTKLTFSQPVQIPGKVLPAGSYLFKLANTNDRHIVQVFNSDGIVLYATLMAIPTERREPTGDSVVTFAEQGDELVAGCLSRIKPLYKSFRLSISLFGESDDRVPSWLPAFCGNRHERGI